MGEILLIINLKKQKIKLKCQRNQLLTNIIKAKNININDIVFYYKKN